MTAEKKLDVNGFIGRRTFSLWMVIFAPFDYPRARLHDHVEEARALMESELAPPGEQVRTLGQLLPRR